MSQYVIRNVELLGEDEPLTAEERYHAERFFQAEEIY